MTVLTVNINGKKDKKALEALKAVIEALGLNYDLDENRAKPTAKAVSVPVDEWEQIQKRLNTETFYDEFSESIMAIKEDINGESPLKSASELLHGH